jgi:hypothetical protein
MNSPLKSVFIGCAVAIALVATAASAAQPDIGVKGVGVRLGYVDPESSWDGTVEFGADMQLGEWIPQLKWDASISYWKSTLSWGYLSSNYDWSLSDIAIRTGVNYELLKGPWVPYVGGGLGLHMYSFDYSNAPNYPGTHSDSKLGLYLDGGVTHNFNAQWSGQAQLQFDFADNDQTAIMLQAIYHLGK